MKHFAYGSNMDIEDMDKWCDEHHEKRIDLSHSEINKLCDYKIDFTRWSDRREGGVADIISSPGDFCWGVVFDISKKEFEILDREEGVKVGAYARLDDLPEGLITYEVVKEKGKKIKSFQPHNKYVDLIIKGAKEHGLPESWIKKLESFKNV